MFLLDTNVVSDAQKRVPEPLRWLAAVDPDLVYLSVITVGEIERGIERLRSSNAAKRAILASWLADLRRENAQRILPVTDEVAIAWGRLSISGTTGEADGLIAATALVHQLILVTRNVSDFRDAGVEIINPWS